MTLQQHVDRWIKNKNKPFLVKLNIMQNFVVKKITKLREWYYR